MNQNRVVRLIVPIVALISPFALLKGLLAPVHDPDVHWHVVAGNYLLQAGQFRGPDPTLALSDHPWVLHEWLGEVPIALSYRLWGYPGIVVWTVILGLLLFVIVYRSCRAVASPVRALIGTFVMWIAAAGSIAPRPQMLSFILVAVFVAAWRVSLVDGRRRWWLVPLTWAWACAHGMWFLGVGIGVLAMMTAIHGRGLGDSLRRFGPLVGASVVASLLTPLGYHVWEIPFQMRAYTRFVSEWRPLGLFHLAAAVGLGALLLVAVAWLLVPRLKPTAFDVAIWVVAVLCFVAYARTAAIGAVLLAPLLADTLERLAPQPAERARRWDVHLLTGACAAALLVAGFVAHRADLDPTGAPTGLAPQLSAIPAGSIVYNDYSAGGWLLLAQPHLRPVIDGRSEIYEIGRFGSIINSFGMQRGWEDTVRSTGARWAVLKDGEPLAQGLRGILRWTRVAQSEGWILLQSP